MPKRIQLPDDFYKHDFKQLAKIEKHPRTRIRFIGLSHIQQKDKETKSLLTATIRIMQGLIRARERIFVLALIAMVKPLRKDWKNLLSNTILNN
jgi:hypothetical protein